jgi:signal transduction histidine kinase/DNA-binding NarL/FixJ family response regulator
MNAARRPIQVLYVDDNYLDRELVRDVLEKADGEFCVKEATGREDFLELLSAGAWDLVLTDFRIGGFEGLEVIEEVKKRRPGVPVVMLTGTGSEEVAVQALKRGAADYVLKKTQHIQRLPFTLRSALERTRAQEAERRVTRELRALTECNQALLRAGDVQSLYDDICRIVCEVAGYRLAWVGLTGADGVEALDIVARAGHCEWLPASGCVTPLGQADPCCVLAWDAVRCDSTVCDQDVPFPSESGANDESARLQDRSSVVALPLRGHDGAVFGALVICAGKPDALTPDELRLLEELAGDLAYGVTALHFREEMRHTEEELRQSQKMDAIGQLAGGIAHDFNNILTIILGYSEIILAGGDGGDFETLQSEVEVIRAAAERASALTRQILAFSRRQALVSEVVCPNEVVCRVRELIRRTLGEQIDIVTLLSEDLGLVEVDAGQLEQVLVNMALNSRDAMPKGGKLTMETANVALEESYCHMHPDARPGSYVMVAVSDNGTGMDEQTKSRIFEPFFTTKGPDKGTGLGLATAYAWGGERIQDLSAADRRGGRAAGHRRQPVRASRRARDRSCCRRRTGRARPGGADTEECRILGAYGLLGRGSSDTSERGSALGSPSDRHDPARWHAGRCGGRRGLAPPSRPPGQIHVGIRQRMGCGRGAPASGRQLSGQAFSFRGTHPTCSRSAGSREARRLVGRRAGTEGSDLPRLPVHACGYDLARSADGGVPTARALESNESLLLFVPLEGLCPSGQQVSAHQCVIITR